MRAHLALASCALAAMLALPSSVLADEDEEDEALRQRLTEREDRRRPAEPFHVDVAGRPLTIGGEYEVDLASLRRRVFGETAFRRDQLRVEQSLDLEVFYSWGKPASVFAQVSLQHVDDLLSNTFEEESDLFVERGEMWLYTEDIAGSGVNVDIGRLDFEDERRWWWDEELDGVRLELERESWDLAVALAREIAPTRSDRSWVEPENDRVLRWIVELGWDVRENHVLELFLLHQDDHSPTEEPGTAVRQEREDDSDGRLTWLGARLMGVFELRSRGILGYWLDVGAVRGRERRVEFESLSPTRSVVDSRHRQDVRGWAFDGGAAWILPGRLEPRIFVGYAIGSGDSDPEEGSGRDYRQSGLHANEAGFGGVERFPSYGLLLNPELSNLRVLTFGLGFSLLSASSLDLVYHHYRLDARATGLLDSLLEVELDGRHRDLGQALDLVLALEEWERFEAEVQLSVFRAGRAFGPDDGRWSAGAFVALRYAF